jgi:hypothetical protein
MDDVLVERPEAYRSLPPALSALDSLSKPIEPVSFKAIFGIHLFES